MKIYKYPYGPIDANMYVLETSQSCVIIDPCVSLSYLPEFAAPFKAIIVTHCHYDHINRMEELRDALKIPVYAYYSEFRRYGDPVDNGSAFFMSEEEFSRPDIEIHDDDTMDMGEGVSLRFIHTPGHSPGSICILVTENGKQKALFSGDTLFRMSAGRTDLGGNPLQLRHSLDILRKLDGDVTVYSGHGDDTTLAEEKKYNPFLSLHLRSGNLL